MGNLQQALVNLGVLQEGEIRVSEAEEQLAQEERERVSRKRAQEYAAVEDLDLCSTMDQFKRTAKLVLERDSRLISTVIHKAHRFQNPNDEAARAFIKFFYDLRNHLSGIPNSQKNILLDRAFRRRRPTFNIG